jgi:hypothetical protein
MILLSSQDFRNVKLCGSTGYIVHGDVLTHIGGLGMGTRHLSVFNNT